MERIIIHPGFNHSGTKLLQNYLKEQKEIHFCNPISDKNLGGIFSYIKFLENNQYDLANQKKLKNELIFSKNNKKILVVSDESLVDQTEVYYAPRHLPTDIIGERLKELFGNATILFTIRNQFDYVKSVYFNLKKNYALLSKRRIESFSEWFKGQDEQISPIFLRNLDYYRSIEIYSKIFGIENIKILPLEWLTSKNSIKKFEYLSQFKNIFNLKIDNESKLYENIVNERLTRFENLLINYLPLSFLPYIGLHADQSSREKFKRIAKKLKLDKKIDFELNHEQKARIITLVGKSNNNIENIYGVDLKNFGYPV